MTHLLQTSAWAKFQRALGKTVIERDGDGWHYIAVVEGKSPFRRVYAPYGPVARDKNTLQAALIDLASQARSHDGAYVRVEPIEVPVSEDELRTLGLQKSRKNVQVQRTWVVDLSAPEADIIAAMNATNRNLHRNIQKKDVTMRSSRDPKEISILLNFLHATAERNRFTPQSDSYLQTAADILMPHDAMTLFVAEHERTPVAAALAYDDDTTRIYMHAASDENYRKLSAGLPLVSTMILDAKAKGLKRFDLWGIAPPDQPNHPWTGFTKFKQSFGGHEELRCGTWELPVSRLRYSLYTYILRILK